MVSLSEETSLYTPSRKIKLTQEEKKRRKNEKRNQSREKTQDYDFERNQEPEGPACSRSDCKQEENTQAQYAETRVLAGRENTIL